MNALTRRILQADADYFARKSFISSETRDRVRKWLNGNKDKEIQIEAANWLECDADWVEQVAPAVCRFHWFLLIFDPLILFAMRVIPKKLRREAKELRETE